MNEHVPYVVTISRQLGSGGALLGRRLAKELGILYADRDILEQAAKLLDVNVRAAESRDESAPSFLKKVFESFAYGGPEVYCAPSLQVPSYEELRDAEIDVIREIAAQRSAVIVGRAGFHLLALHPRRFSIFLYADLHFRAQRVQELYGLSRERALHVIDESDRVRERSVHELTGRPWTDTLQYDVSLCTSSLGLELAGRVILELVRHHIRAH